MICYPPFRYLFVCEEWLAIDSPDGRTSKTLRVSTLDTQVNSGLLLRHNANRKLFDDHIWLSVIYKNPWSRFTRKQRLSVCLALLFLTMITNAMWYQTDQNSSSGVFSFGPITISMTELMNSIWSSLIVIPPIMLITNIFLNLRPRDAPKQDVPFDEPGSNDDLWVPPKKKFQFPYWCIYVAWILIVLSVLVSAFFIILYSFQWGGATTNAWLAAFFLSLFESVVFIQPVKVIFHCVSMLLSKMTELVIIQRFSIFSFNSLLFRY